MEINALSVLALLAQIVGFACLCVLGGRLSDKFKKKWRWIPLAVAAVAIMAGLLICFVLPQPLTFSRQIGSFFCIAFGGGLVVRMQQNEEEQQVTKKADSPMTSAKEKLLALVGGMVSRYPGRRALEHNAGDYRMADCMSHQPTGIPVALWLFDGECPRSERFAGQKAPLYFHIDEANNRAVVVVQGFLSGRGYVIDGADDTVTTLWMS